MFAFETLGRGLLPRGVPEMLLAAGLGLAALALACAGLYGLQAYSVSRQTREIGVRIAVGARRADIVNQFLTEAVLVCLVGGVLGIAAALGTGALIGWLSDSMRLSFSTLSILVAFFSSTLIGITFGFLPARAAARLDPVVALSRE